MAEKKKIVHLLYSGLGGHASVFFSLTQGDKQKEFNFGAIFCGIESLRKQYREQCEEQKLSYISVLKRRGLDISVYWKIFKGFQKLQADIVFLHGSNFIMSAWLYKILHLGRVKIIIRDTQAHHLKSRFDWFWLKVASLFTDKFIFLAEESLLGASKGFLKRKIQRKSVVIANGLDISKYKPGNSKNSNERITIGMQSRLQQIKDHPTLLRAFRLLLNRNPDKFFFLKIAGEGETMNSLKSMVGELELQDNVEFSGMLSEDELILFMNSLDIYVHATVGETMSNSIMQAMACGLPIIASDVWGVSNMISDNVDGLLYPPGNSEVLMLAITDLVENENKRKLLSVNARHTAKEVYSHEMMFERYKQLFQRL